MVLAMWWLKKLKRESEEKQAEARREGLREGREEGWRDERQRWEAWARHVEAEARAAGISITEPPTFDDE